MAGLGRPMQEARGLAFYLVGEQVAHLRDIINEASSSRKGGEMKG